jgi:hypothetical protein
MATANLIVTIDNEREVEAVNAWFRRWGPRIRVSDNDGCGCCVDIWRVDAPAEALTELPHGMVTPSEPSPRALPPH